MTVLDAIVVFYMLEVMLGAYKLGVWFGRKVSIAIWGEPKR